MSKDELLDVVSEKGEVIGQKLCSECHSNPNIIHQVVHCWIFNSRGQVLWQQRSLDKKESPGKWDMSCGGHVKAGKTPQETLIAELDEELGIKDVEINFVGKYIDGNEKQTEMIYLYYLVFDNKESSFKLQKEEVEQVKWFDIHEAQMLVFSGEYESTHFIFSQMPRILQYVFSKNTDI